MLKLFKYNWRVSEVLFYSLSGLTLLVYTILYILTHKGYWWAEFSILAAFGFVSIMLQILTIFLIYHFNSSLKSTVRRLLPVSAVKEYIAAILIPIIYNVVHIMLLVLFIAILNPVFQTPEINEFIATLNLVEIVTSVFIMSVGYSVFSFAMTYLAVAIARLFRTNMRVLLFVAFMVAITFVYGILSGVISMNDPQTVKQGLVTVETSSDYTFTINWFTFHWTQLVEVAFTLICAFATVYIMKRKLEV